MISIFGKVYEVSTGFAIDFDGQIYTFPEIEGVTLGNYYGVTGIPAIFSTTAGTPLDVRSVTLKITLKCLGIDYNAQHVYLNGGTADGSVGLAPQTTGKYSGTYWQVEGLPDGSIALKCLRTDYNAQHVYLNGGTADGSVGLAPQTTGKYSGTHWQVEGLPDGSIALKCLGTDYNAQHVYLNGGTADGSVGLAPQTTGKYSGAHWKPEPIFDEGDVAVDPDGKSSELEVINGTAALIGLHKQLPDQDSSVLVSLLERGDTINLISSPNEIWTAKFETSDFELTSITITSDKETLSILPTDIKASQDPDGQKQTMKFINNCPHEVEVFHVNSSGQETMMFSVLSGHFVVHECDVNHPCRTRLKAGGHELSVFIPTNPEGTQECLIDNTLIGFVNKTRLNVDIYRVDCTGEKQLEKILSPEDYIISGNSAVDKWEIYDAYSQIKIMEIPKTREAVTLHIEDITESFTLPAPDSATTVQLKCINSSKFDIDLYSVSISGELSYKEAVKAGNESTISASPNQFFKALECYSQNEIASFITKTSPNQQVFNINPMSQNDETPTKVKFVNESLLDLIVNWVDYDGDEKLYCEIAPYGEWLQDTFVTHPWVVREKETGQCIKYLVSGIPEKQPVIRITENDLHSLKSTIDISKTISIKNSSSIKLDVMHVDSSQKEELLCKLTPSQVSNTLTITEEILALKFVSSDAGDSVGQALFKAQDFQVNQTVNYKITAKQCSDSCQIVFVNKLPMDLTVTSFDKNGNKSSIDLGAYDALKYSAFLSQPLLVQDPISKRVLAVAIGGSTSEEIAISDNSLRSLPTSTAVNLEFINSSPFEITIFWIDFDGNPVLKWEVGSPPLANGFISCKEHAWKVVIAGTNALLGVYILDDSPNQVIKISAPPANDAERPGGELYSGEVAIYDQANYTGHVWILRPDLPAHLPWQSPEYTLGYQGLNILNVNQPASQSGGALNISADPKIGSLKLGPNTGITLFPHANFQGAGVTYYSNTAEIPSTVQCESLSIWESVPPSLFGISSRSSLTEKYEQTKGKISTSDRAWYRTIISLPMGISEADIYAENPVTLLVEDTPYSIDSVKPARIRANLCQKIVIYIDTKQLTGSKLVGVPALLVRAGKMAENQRITIYPDADLHYQVATLQPHALYANRERLSSNSNSPLIKMSKEQVGHVQSTIQNVVKSVQYNYKFVGNSTCHSRLVTHDNMEHPNWELSLGDDGPSYKALTASQVTQKVQDAQFVKRPNAQWGWNPIHAIKKLTSIVVHTTENVAVDAYNTAGNLGKDVVNTAVNVGKHTANTVVHVGEDLVHGDVATAGSDLANGTLSVGKDLASGTLEIGGDLTTGTVNVAKDITKGAVQLVVVTVKHIEDGIEKAIQFVLNDTGLIGHLIDKLLTQIELSAEHLLIWLMSKLPWGNILQIQKNLIETYNTSLDLLVADTEAMQKRVSNLLSTAKQDVSADIDNLLASMGSPEVPPHKATNRNHSKAMEHTEWLASTFSERAKSAKNSVSGFSGARLTDFCEKVASKVENDLPKIENELSNAKIDLLEAISHPGSDFKLLSASALEMAKAGDTLAFDLLESIVEEIFEVIEEGIKDFKNTGNASLDIPFVTELYTHITKGGKLTPLGLYSLLLSIPTSFFASSASMKPLMQQGAKEDLEVDIWGSIYGWSHIISGGLPFKALGKPSAKAKIDWLNKTFGWIDLASFLMAQIAGNPLSQPSPPRVFRFDGQGDDSLEIAHHIWDYQWGLLGIDLIDQVLTATVPEGDQIERFANKMFPVIHCVAGIVHIGLMIKLAVLDGKKVTCYIDYLKKYKPELSPNPAPQSPSSQNAYTDPYTNRLFTEKTSKNPNIYKKWGYSGVVWKSAGNIFDTVPQIAGILNISDNPRTQLLASGLQAVAHIVEGAIYLKRTTDRKLL